jgi:hypothetical protein
VGVEADSVPHKKVYRKDLPDWLDTLDDPCLETTVVEAIVARREAVRDGAENYPACKAALRSGDLTLDTIASGRVRGKAAWKKAADALRKYTSAGECVRPTATRRQQGLIGTRA